MGSLDDKPFDQGGENNAEGSSASIAAASVAAENTAAPDDYLIDFVQIITAQVSVQDQRPRQPAVRAGILF